MLIYLTDAWPVPCIYCQMEFDRDIRSYISAKLHGILNKQVCLFERSESADDDDSPTVSDEDVDEDSQTVSEWRFAPSDKRY